MDRLPAIGLSGIGAMLHGCCWSGCLGLRGREREANMERLLGKTAAGRHSLYSINPFLLPYICVACMMYRLHVSLSSLQTERLKLKYFPDDFYNKLVIFWIVENIVGV